MITVSMFFPGVHPDRRPIGTQVVRQWPIRPGTSDGMSAPHGPNPSRHRCEAASRPHRIREVSP